MVNHDSSEILAQKLRQNWLLRIHEIGKLGLENGDDGSLTNLDWLQNTSVAKLMETLPLFSPMPAPQTPTLIPQPPLRSFLRQQPPSKAKNTLELYRQHCLNYGIGRRQNMHGLRSLPKRVHNGSNPFSKRKCKPPLSQVQVIKALPTPVTLTPLAVVPTEVTNRLPTIESLSLEERQAFQTNRMLRPPFSYTVLICMSMLAVEKNKVTLDDIYSWVAENFAFYRDSEPTWKLALRQTLTRNPTFQRVPRRKEEPGGWGDLWRLHPSVRTKFSIEPTSRTRLFQQPSSPSKASVVAPRLIIQSIMKSGSGKELDQPRQRDVGPTSPKEKNADHQRVTEEDSLLTVCGKDEGDGAADWWSQGGVDQFMGDMNSDPNPTDYSISTPETPIDEQVWMDERLNLEELDNILGLK